MSMSGPAVLAIASRQQDSSCGLITWTRETTQADNAWRRSTLPQAPWTTGLLEVTAFLPLALSHACSERHWTMTWAAVERLVLPPGINWLVEASLAAAFHAAVSGMQWCHIIAIQC